MDCCFQKIDVICVRGDQSGRDWSWTYHGISHKTIVDGYNFRTCLTMCEDSSDGPESVLGIGLDVFSDVQLLLNVLGPCGQTCRPVCLISLILILDAERKLVLPMIWRARSSFDVVVFNRYPRCPLGKVALTNTASGIVDVRWHPVTLR